MNILIFGATGFIGKNLVSSFSSRYQVETAKIDEDEAVLVDRIKRAKVIINASGVSRSDAESDFFLYNIYHAQRLFSLINGFDDKTYFYFSSIHYATDSIYGFSKRYNEFLLSQIGLGGKNGFICLRIPSIFGPGIKPNYVSVVATFCNNIARGIECNIIDGEKTLQLLYINDLVLEIDRKIIETRTNGFELIENFSKIEKITVKKLFDTIKEIELNEVDGNGQSTFLNNLATTYKFYKN